MARTTSRHRPVRGLVTAAAALALLAGGVTALLAVRTPAARAATDDIAWTGTWAVAPQSSNATFNQQTLRQIVHTSIGGTIARIHLSNVFGSQPVTFTDVQVAQSAGGSSIVTGSARTVTFAGSGSVTIPAGGSAVSDTITFAVGAESNVTVSFYLPSPTGSATQHQLGNQTSYTASGDVAGQTTLSNTSTSGSYSFLTNLDVQNPAAEGAVVALGASITDGYRSTYEANHRWPNLLASRLNSAGHTVGVLNAGISGNDLLKDGAGPSALNRFQRDVIQQPGVKWVIFSDDPINDLGDPNPPTATQLIAGIQQLISTAHGAGIKFICSTLTPFKGADYWTQNGENGREAINNFIRGAGSGCDYVLDQDNATHNPSDVQTFLPAYDSGDHLHPNDLGYQAIANAVDIPTIFGASSGARDLAAGRPAQASSVEPGSNLVAANAVDGSDVTRWASDHVDPSWLSVDLGSNYAISRVRLNWEAAYGKAYLIQTSTDGNNWTAIYPPVTDGDGGIDDLTVSGSGRYVRMYGTQRGTQWGYSLWSFQVFGSAGGVRDLAAGRPAQASSVEPGSNLVAANAVDGSDVTRWASDHVDPSWLSVDLGSNYAISRVRLNWEAAYGKAYLIQTSTDGNNWTAIYPPVTDGDGGIDDLTVSGSGRYVRMYGTQRGTQWGYSLWSFQVFGG